MLGLLQLLSVGESPTRYAFEIAELQRELGQFYEATQSLKAIDMEDAGLAGKLLAELIEGKEAAPVRYRL
jgi:hypothetical protein